ncbi:MAG: nicotinate-nucleotide--dimethylbenzimidazole phosphoribosyltransferase [Clostridiales bacterium]|nr:nicotinate-nucleotide--dimethylbenzimidazole phosphoribosyltransferase [Clostridiales bacterium]
MKELKMILESIGELDQAAMANCKSHLDQLTKPQGSLGVLEDISITMAGITGQEKPVLTKKTTVIMAADHGVTDEGISAFPKEVTPQMVLNFLNGGAAINVLSRLNHSDILCVDLGIASDIEHPNLINRKIAYGTKNMRLQASMTREEALKAIKTGIEIADEAVKSGTTLLATGEMGIGNTTASSAILTVFTDLLVEKTVGAGTGISPETIGHKQKVIQDAINRNQPDKNDPIDVLSKVGGFEIAGLTGLIIGAAKNRVPVVIDGFISTAAALIAYELEAKTRDFMISSHLSEETGHKLMLDYLGLKPMLHLNFRLGEGTGAVMAFNLIDASSRILEEMATFESAGVSTK